MSRPRSWPRLTGLALAGAFTLTLLSVSIERVGPEPVQYGNLCGPAGFDPCYKPALKGGFPFAYLVDAPGISVERQLAFVEDDFYLVPFVLDVAVYVALCLSAALLVRRKRGGA